MVLAEHSGGVSEDAARTRLSSEQHSEGPRPSVTSVTPTERMRAKIRDLDRSTCQTRQSQRRFLIQLQAGSDLDCHGGLQRYRESMMIGQSTGRVVDWD